MAWQRKLDTTTYIYGVNCIFYSHHAPMPRSYYPFLMQNCIALQKLETQDDKLRETLKRSNMLHFDSYKIEIAIEALRKTNLFTSWLENWGFLLSAIRGSRLKLFPRSGVRPSPMAFERTLTPVGFRWVVLAWGVFSPAPVGRGRAPRAPRHTHRMHQWHSKHAHGDDGDNRWAKMYHPTNYITVIRT